MIFHVVNYVYFFLMVAGVIWLVKSSRNKYDRLKKNGIKVNGFIISNQEKTNGNNDFYRLGGNFNTPTVRFVTQNGDEITGTPVIGFVTQYEVHPPVPVIVFYDPRQPEKFCITLA